jgi:CRP/FNR family cyclic AMP-dependent transcriptional regulator
LVAAEFLRSETLNAGDDTVTPPGETGDATFFDDFSRHWADKSRKFALEKSLPKGALLFSQGDDSDGLFIIKEGRAKVFIGDESGKEMVIAILGPGEVVGEIASLDGEVRTASVETLEPCAVLHIAQTDFKGFLAENHELAFEIIQVLTRRIRNYAASVSNLAFKNVYERIVTVLEQNSEEKDDGTRVVTGAFTHQDFSDMVGSSREMVSRVFSELTKGGYISTDHRVITIHKKLPKGW